MREIGLAAGLVDNKVCAIDATWSGLRFVWRLRDRPRASERRQRLKTPTSGAPRRRSSAITATAMATMRSSRSGGSSTPVRIASSTRCQRAVAEQRRGEAEHDRDDRDHGMQPDGM